MKKFRLSSWLGQGHSANGTDATAQDIADQKKQNRRSFSGLSRRSKREPAPAPATSAAPEEKVEQDNTPSRMVTLANTISTETAKLQAYLHANGLPDPGFGVDAPKDFPALPDDMQRTRRAIMAAARELESLTMGPREIVRWGAWSHLDSLSLQVACSYGLAKLVPFEGSIALTELQSKTTLDPVNVARILRHNMTNYIFCEPSPGFIAHTSASRQLAEDTALQAWVGFNTEDLFPSAAHSLQALKAHPEATSLTRAGFNFAFGTVDKEPMFATLSKDPTRAQRFGRAMVSLTGGEGYEVSYFVDSYDFASLNEQEGTFVDIGGSHGFVCVELAKKWDKMKFIVQDLPKMLDSAPNPICGDEAAAKRIQLQPHDFFTKQPAEGADVYYFRWIFHNYSTPYAVSILKNLVPALKPGARIIINDICIREPGSETPWDEKLVRGMDLVMLSLLNAQERTEEEFRGLFAAADEGYSFKGVTRVSGCRMSVVEAVWEPKTEVAAVEEPNPEETKPEETKAEE
ncbi:putative O-methyltransferase [Stachybotrys elegans]|uniref:O-methyltransferase n=1 Tax=Stachybotrys elegans TaxID=80388 RepID=A0A8K0WPR4_9HYPO|nr:putative O-methyltransferase [Stachybotrys elegans]